MASKTVVWTISGLVGETGLSLLLFDEGGNTVLNGSGDTLTNSSYGRLTCTVTEALAAGWYDAVVIDGSSNLVTERGPDAKLYLPGDIAGTYTVGSLSVPTTKIVTGRMIRLVSDTQPIIFPWSIASASLSGTRAIGTESPVALVGDIDFLYTLNGQNVYSLAYDAADRPTEANSVIYRITDGSEYGYIILDVTNVLTLSDVQSGATVLSPVTQAGKLATIVIGDDYLAAYGRAFQWTIDAPTGFVLGTSTCSFGGEAERGTASWLSSGTITDVGGSRWTLKFNLTKTQTGALTEGLYKWSVEVKAADSTEHTVVRWGEGARVVEKQT